MSPLPSLTANKQIFHIAVGPKKPSEIGVNFTASTFGNAQAFVQSMLGTTPASATRVSGMNSSHAMSTNSSHGMAHSPSRMSNIAYVGDVTSIGGAANRIYSRLSQRDPRAVQALNMIVGRAEQGDEHAKSVHTHLLSAIDRSKQLGWGSQNAAQVAAAHRLYGRLQARDPRALSSVHSLAGAAKSGHLGAKQGLWLLDLIHKSQSTGTDIGDAAISLPASRVSELVRMMKQAQSGPVASAPMPTYTTLDLTASPLQNILAPKPQVLSPSARLQSALVRR